MSEPFEVPASLHADRDKRLADVAARLDGRYDDRDRERLSIPELPAGAALDRLGDKTVDWDAMERVLDALMEFVNPGLFTVRRTGKGHLPSIAEGLRSVADALYSILYSSFRTVADPNDSADEAFRAALNLVARLPEIRAKTYWNQFASLKDPAVWDSYVVNRLGDHHEIGAYNLIEKIDEAIAERDPEIYFDFLRGKGIGDCIDYQMNLVRRSYPGWRALLLHEIAHILALGGKAAGNGVESSPTPILPRLIGEYGAHLFQTDLHPETVIGDANFLEHPHRGITTGQTGTIGIGCIVYPCTLGGVTDKVKKRHPALGDFVLIGTDVGIFGPVDVGERSVVGPNTEINGFVEIGRHVKIRAAVVARTVLSGSGRPGRLIFEDDVVVGEESLIINDHATDLIIPAGARIPPHSYVVNDGAGAPTGCETDWP
jgi:serine acetyltransferase